MATQIRMRDFPGTQPVRDFWQMTHDTPPAPAQGEVLVRLNWLSVDPAMRGWIIDTPSYLPPVQPGEVMRGFGVGEVLESKADGFSPGDCVAGFTGIATHATLNAASLRKIDTTIAPPELFLSGLGHTGSTAYFGLMDHGVPQEGETVVVSGAAGAVGSVAVQVARKMGARVVGIAGGPAKCAYLSKTLGVEHVIDYKNDALAPALQDMTPKGVDVYFDNVGGETLNAVFRRMNYRGRIVVCGAISQYGDVANATGPAGFLKVISHSLTIRGFTMTEYMHRIPEAFAYLVEGYKDGSLLFREHILEGIESFPEAFEMLFDGRNNGKLLIKVI